MPSLIFILSKYDVRHLRYRHCLWILGNATTLLSSGSIWADLVRNAKDRQCFFAASGDKALSRVIAKQKSDLNRVEVKRNTPLVSSRTACFFTAYAILSIYFSR